MLQRYFLLLVVIICSTSFLFGQKGFTAQKMDKAINTPYDEFNPVISSDGKIIYFTRANHPQNTHDPEVVWGPDDNQDIWFSRFEPTGKWSEAQRLPFPLNSGYYNSLLSILDDKKTILLNGVFDKKGQWIRRGLSTSQLGGQGWTPPAELKIRGKLRKNKGKVSNAFLTPDGNTLFLSFSKKVNSSKEDIYISRKTAEKFSKPAKIKKYVNTRKFSETAPYFNAKENKLFFSSNRESGKSGKENYDIYFTKPMDKALSSWSTPVKLGDTINSAAWESYFKINEEGTIAYFARKDTGSTDIYYIKLKEDKPYVEISGSVINNFNGEPLDPKFTFKIYANNSVVDSAVIHPQSSHYVFRLPLGRKYYIKAEAKNHIGIVDSVDVSKVREFTELEKNLIVEPVPFVVLSGKMLLKNGLTPIPDSIKAQFFVDGKPAVFQENNKQTGDYKLHLKFGVKHQIAVKAKGYDMETATIDLTPINRYSEMERDFLLQKLVAPEDNEAIISGQIIDKKTGKPLSSDKPFSIFANDIPATEVNINYTTATYKLVVPLGKSYVINATSSGYYPVYETVDLKNQKTRLKVNKDLIIAPIEVGMSVKLNNIFFETGKATLKKESFPELQRVIKFLKENENIKIEISGHTDNVGLAASNFILSENRAAAVVHYIEGAGIPSNRLIAKGYGSTKPVGSNTTKQGKAANRRVEFVIIDK